MADPLSGIGSHSPQSSSRCPSGGRRPSRRIWGLAAATLLMLGIGCRPGGPPPAGEEPEAPTEAAPRTEARVPEESPRWPARTPEPDRRPFVQVGGVFPHLTVVAPGVGSRTEAGIGALIPWADRLWAIGYVAHIKGEGLGLYEIAEDMSMRLHPASVTGTFANRMVHWESDQAFIGPHAIDASGRVRTIDALAGHRLAATMRHLEDPKRMVYVLTMEGLLFEVDVETLEAAELFDLVGELALPEGAQPHFKSGHTAQGRVVVANNTYEEPEYRGERRAGCLAEWDGSGPWRVVERNPFVEVAGKQNPAPGSRFGDTMFALGWSRSAAILRVLQDGVWTRYLLPKGSHAYDHTWTTEWMRIREAQTERYLMDAHGIFYELPGIVYGGRVWGVRPIAAHLRLVTDFCHWRGLFVMAGDQTDNAVGQPQSGLWFGAIDDLWSMGEPRGWGGPWRDDEVEAGVPSDPFLMTGFRDKVLHLSSESDRGVRIRIEIDALGDGAWKSYENLILTARGYVHHEFPRGFAAHWVRLVPDRNARVTAVFHYN